jgi:formylglycine-generating enzyme required for sulfatase activity
LIEKSSQKDYIKLCKSMANFMDADQALVYLKQLVFEPTGVLNDKLTENLLKSAWVGETYETIAKQLGYEESYLRDRGSGLFQWLREVFQEPINKQNFKAVVERKFKEQQPFGTDFPPGMAELTLQKEAKQAHYFTEALGKVGLDMIFVEGDKFQMGSREDEPERYGDEGPQHLVQVPAFFMGRYPITQAQWRVVAERIPQVNQELNPKPSEFKGDNLPVEQVNWFDAVEFCDRLSAHTKRQYRLPSEAEWEYACRAGTKTAFYYGSTITPELANYDSEVSQTTPVGQYVYPNAWGLSDMHGNVWEWCADHWHEDYEEAPTDGSAWLDEGAEPDARRLGRGGSWGDLPQNCRSAYRSDGIPRVAYSGIGFRVVCLAPRILP